MTSNAKTSTSYRYHAKTAELANRLEALARRLREQAEANDSPTDQQVCELYAFDCRLDDAEQIID